MMPDERLRRYQAVYEHAQFPTHVEGLHAERDDLARVMALAPLAHWPVGCTAVKLYADDGQQVDVAELASGAWRWRGRKP